MTYKNFKARTYAVVELASQNDTFSKVFDMVIIVLIVLSVLLGMLETVEGFATKFRRELWIFEVVSITVFSIEYLLRLWSCNSSLKYEGRLAGRIKWIFSFFGIIDLLAILPFFLPIFFGDIDLRFLRLLRIARFVRLLKFGRYSKTLAILGNVLKKKADELLVTVFIALFMVLIVSSMMYFVENHAQPDVFTSIPATMWWGIVTLTTVGYGDMAPITPLGKVLAGISGLLGIGLIGLPAGILGAAFTEELTRFKDSTNWKD